MTVAYQGAPGAFSHEACLRYLPDHEPVPLAAFSDVIEAVELGRADFGILPLSNNEAGETGARSLIEGSGLRIAAQHVLPVRMHLLGLPSATLDGLRTVASHPVALRQCARTLSRLGLQTEEATNTAVAARGLSRVDHGVLASEAAADQYGLAILMRDLQDRPDNATTFAVVARSEP